ncbi:MAG: hypothetical protein M3O50_00290, partial [Myxococcota bacterium]|nr:hypothetical protein [Myxococcota bacterium]
QTVALCEAVVANAARDEQQLAEQLVRRVEAHTKGVELLGLAERAFDTVQSVAHARDVTACREHTENAALLVDRARDRHDAGKRSLQAARDALEQAEIEHRCAQWRKAADLEGFHESTAAAAARFVEALCAMEDTLAELEQRHAAACAAAESLTKAGRPLAPLDPGHILVGIARGYAERRGALFTDHDWTMLRYAAASGATGRLTEIVNLLHRCVPRTGPVLEYQREGSTLRLRCARASRTCAEAVALAAAATPVAAPATPQIPPSGTRWLSDEREVERMVSEHRYDDGPLPQ